MSGDEPVASAWGGSPEDGHTFRFTVEIRGSGGIMGPGDSAPHDHADSDWWGEPWTLEVRAWSLADALKLAAGQGLGEWRRPDGRKLGDGG